MTASAIWLRVGGVAVTVVLIGGAMGGYIREHDLRTSAEATAKSAAQVIAANQQAIAARDKADQAQQQAAAAAAAEVTTSAQAVRIITQYVPVPQSQTSTNQQSAAVAQPSQVDHAVTQQLPDAPSYVVQTQAQSVAVAQQLIKCKADQSSLSTCQADRTALQSSLTAETQAAEQWERTAKGGTVWQRVKAAGKWLVIGAAAGAAAGYTAHK